MSFTIDGSKAIHKAIREICPKSCVQRCLTHIHRQVHAYNSKNPQSECGKELQKFLVFSRFENKRRFLETFDSWEKQYKDFLNERSCSKDGKRTWYTHRRLRQAKSHLKNALPYMFHCKDHNTIKRSSNDLESINALITEHIYRHRGLRVDRLISFLALWLYNRNLK